jgi:protease II
MKSTMTLLFRQLSEALHREPGTGSKGRAPLAAAMGLPLVTVLAVACGSPPSPNAAPSPPLTAATATGGGAASEQHGYSGHGVASLAPEVLAKYRPRPLAPEISRHIQALMDVRAPGIGRLSPDGKTLFFNWSITGVSQIWRVDGPLHFPSELTGGEDVTRLASITPNGAWLIIERDRKGEENPGLYLESPAGGPLTLIQHLPQVQTHYENVSNDSRFIYFSANDRKPDSYVIYRWDVGARTKEAVFDQDGLWHVADVKDDGRLLLVKENGSVWTEYSEWDPAKKVLTPLLGQGEKEEYDAAYGAKEGELVVRTNKPSDFRRLYSWAAGRLSPLGDELHFDVESFEIDRKKTRIVYQVNDNGFTRLRAMDAKTYRPIKLPALPESDRAYAGPTTPDGRFTTIGIDDGRHPVQGYVLDWRTGALAKWHAPATPETDTTTFARARLDSYTARDGTKIPVLVRKPDQCPGLPAGPASPAQAAGPPCAVIVEFHGGPEAQVRPGFSIGAQMYVDAGFILVQPNVRGSDGYGKAWLRADDGPKRLDIITDIEDAAKWAREAFASQGQKPKVGIAGGSYGGYSSLIGMTMFAGAYDAGFDNVGISDLRTFLKNTAPYRRILRISEYGDPDKDSDALAKLSPLTYIDRVKAPLLIMQGASDPRVPAGEAIQIHDALVAKGVPTELMIFPDEGHGSQKRENIVLTIGHAIGFFQKYLQGR